MTFLQHRLGSLCLALLFAFSLVAPLLADRPDPEPPIETIEANAIDAATRVANGAIFLRGEGGPGVDTPEHSAAHAPVSALRVAPAEPIAPPPMRNVSLMLDWFLSPHHAAIIVARARGDFDRHGLNVTLSTPADPSVPTKLVADSRVDLALGRQTQLHRQIDNGMPLIRVATLVGTPLNSLTVLGDSRIESLSQLKGSTVGYALKEDIQPTLSVMLEHHGLTLEDIELEHVDFALTPALAERRVDAVIGAMRHVVPYQLDEEGRIARSFLVEEHGMPRYEELILIGNRDHLNGRQDDFRRLVSALEDATHWIVNHSEEAWRLMVQSEPGLDTPVNRQAWPGIVKRLSLRPATLDARSYLAFQAFLAERGFIGQEHSISRLAVDLSAP